MAGIETTGVIDEITIDTFDLIYPPDSLSVEETPDQVLTRTLSGTSVVFARLTVGHPVVSTAVAISVPWTNVNDNVDTTSNTRSMLEEIIASSLTHEIALWKYKFEF